MISVLCVLLLFFCINFSLVLSMRSLGVTDIDIEKSHMREMMKSMNFGHLHNCLSALKLKQKSFNVIEKDDRESSVSKKGEKSLIFRSKSEYSFFDSENAYYINLDDQIKNSDMIVDLTENSISHCSHAESELKVMENYLSHDVKGKKEKKVLLLGSNQGEWFKSKTANKLFFTLKKTNPLKEHNSIVRVVKEIHRDVTNTNNRCVRMVTEDIHYLELFENMNTESFIDNPYQNNFKQLVKAKNDSKQQQKLRKLGTIVTPDSPVITCDDKYWGDATKYTVNSGGKQSNSSTSTFNYLLGSQGCVSYEATLPGSFNANYDFTTNRAATDPLVIPGVDGIQCSNCYVFLGAGILAIMQYNTGTVVSGSFFRVEIKIAGGAGFNVNLNISNPSISSIKTVPGVISAESEYHKFPIGKTGLSLNYKFGGIDIGVGGSGKASGSFSAGAGASISASAAVLFDGANLTFPITADITVIPPFFKMTAFNLGNSFDVSLGLTGTENFQLAYGTSLASVSVEFNVQATGTTQLTFTSTSKNATSASNRNNNRNRMSSVEVTGDSGRSIFYPGDTLTISFSYEDLLPYEATKLFYSILTNDGREYLIMDRTFSANGEGSGVFESFWKIPWDSNLKSDGTDAFFISVRSSTHILYTFQSSAFHLSMFTDVDTIFSDGPKDGDIIQPDTPLYLKWDPLSLKYFIKDIHSPYGGKEEVAYQAFFNIFMESLDENGTTITQVIKNYTNATILNDGSSEITIASSLSLLGDKFYITINSLKYSNIWSWSSGYFYLKKPANQTNSSKVALKFQRLKNEMITINKKHHRNLQSSCNGNNVALTNSLTNGGSLQSATVSVGLISASLPLSSGAAQAPLKPPATTCLSTSGSGGKSGSDGNSGGISKCSRVLTGALLSAYIGIILMMI